MSFFIVRIRDTPGRMIRTILRGNYGDAQAATQALEKELAKYKSQGRNDEYGYWWARDNKDREFKFVISGFISRRPK